MEKKNIHAGHRARLRGRVLSDGIDNFQDYQVLEYVLSFVVPYKDTNPMAHELINKFGSFKGVLEADIEELKTIKGLGEVSAHFLASLVDIFNFYSKQNNPKETYLSNCKQTEDFFRNVFKGKIVEELYVALVDSNNKLIACKKVAEGNAVEVLTSPRIVSQLVVKHNAHNVIIAHNHPRGTATPSKADIEFTESLIMSLAVTEVKLLDHIIIGEKGEIYSFKRNGNLDERTAEILKLFNFNKLSMSFAKYSID